MIRLKHTTTGNYKIEELDDDDILVDTSENVIVIKKTKHPFMSITDVIEDGTDGDSSIAMSQKGVKNYIVDTEETYTNSANALKAENAAILAMIGDVSNRLAALAAKVDTKS